MIGSDRRGSKVKAAPVQRMQVEHAPSALHEAGNDNASRSCIRRV